MAVTAAQPAPGAVRSTHSATFMGGEMRTGSVRSQLIFDHFYCHLCFWHFPAYTATPHAPFAVRLLVRFHPHWMLIGACNLMACPLQAGQQPQPASTLSLRQRQELAKQHLYCRLGLDFDDLTRISRPHAARRTPRDMFFVATMSVAY